ncbi:hypothetical protein Tco_0501813 [Tanacetum coccineum]
MSSIVAQQAKLDFEVVPKEKRLEIRKCNGRLNPGKTQREPTFQVVLDALALTPYYFVFLTTVNVPEVYMHQFWDSIYKYDTSYMFKMGRKKKLSLNLETFRDIFQICPRVHGQDFDKLPTDEVIRTFATIINISLSGKITGLDKLRLSIAQILWVMYYKNNVDYVELLWEDFTYQIDNRDSSLQNEESQIYGARLPESMTSPEMRETKAYKTYLGYATGVTPPKKERKFKKPTSPKLMTVLASPKEPTKKSKTVKRPDKKSTNAPTAGVVIRDTLSVFVSKKKAPATADRGKDIKLLQDTALLEDAQLKKALMKSRQETHKLQKSGSSEGADFESEVLDELKAKSSNTNEGTGVKLGFPDVSKVDSSESDNKSWGDSDDDNESDDNDDEGSENDDDSDNDAQDRERTDSDEKENPNLNLDVDEEEETQEEEYVHTTDYFVPTDLETDDENMEFDDEEYDDFGSQEKSYEQVVEDVHVTLTTSQKTEGSKQSSSVSSDFASKFLILDNVPPVIDEVASMMNVKVRQEESSTQAPPLLSVPVTAILETSTVPGTIVPSIIQHQQSTPTLEPTTEPSTNLIHAIPNFSSLFGFDHRVSTLENELSQLKQVDHSAQIVTSIRSQIPAMMDDHLSIRIGFATQTALQSYMTEFEKKAQEEKDRYIDLVEKSIKDTIKDEVKSQLPQILPKEVSDFATPVIQSTINESLENVILAKSSSQLKSTYEDAASLTEFELKKILLDKIQKSKSYQDRGLKKRKTSKDVEPTKGPNTKEPKSSLSKGTKSQSKSSRKSVQAKEPEFVVTDYDMPQNQERNLATADKPSKTFDELMRTPIAFSVYIMNGLNISNLTQETMLGLAFKLLKGTHTNFAELEYDFEECYKALLEKLNWDNPEGSDYPFDLTKPIPLVMNGNHQMVSVDYFFNNDLKYLQGGILTITYTTSITKTKAAQYDLQGIEDMVPNIWSPVKVAYDKHALWDISHWIKQCKIFYTYARGLESSHDVYSTKHILAVTWVKVMRKHGYGYLREIEVRRADNELYTFKEGNFPRCCINDIEDMLILVVQNRLTNLLGDDVSNFATAL